MDEEPPEHVVAYQHHLTRLRATHLDDDRTVIVDVLADPDELVSDAAVTVHLDRVAAERRSAAAFRAWVDARLDLLPDGTHRRHRAEQWTACKRITDDGERALDPVVLDDWTQRRLVETSTSPGHLTALARAGRTRRVRAEARARLDEVQLRTAATSTSLEVLRALVADGSTRRVRATARQRLDDLGVSGAPAGRTAPGPG